MTSRRWGFSIGLAMALSVGSCAQLQTGVGKVDELCTKAVPLAQMAAPIPTVGPYIAAGVTVGCTTAEGLSRLNADANSVAWLGEQIGLLRAALRVK